MWNLLVDSMEFSTNSDDFIQMYYIQSSHSLPYEIVSVGFVKHCGFVVVHDQKIICSCTFCNNFFSSNSKASSVRNLLEYQTKDDSLTNHLSLLKPDHELLVNENAASEN